MKTLALGALLALASCATPYAYCFHLENPGAKPASTPGGGEVMEDADIRTEIAVDPTGAQAILVDLSNKTDQVLQVEWTRISVTRSDGSSSTPRPDVDVGSIFPGSSQRARLAPFALPRSGSPAASYQGARFELAIPMIVRRESSLRRYSFTVDVRKL